MSNFLLIKTVGVVLVMVGTVILAGCETTNGHNNTLKKGAIGAAAGALAGAVIGNNAGDGDAQSGALIGAVIGGAGGTYIGCREDGNCGAQKQQKGYYQDSRQYPGMQPEPADKRQYYDQKTGRYYYYDPVSRQEYYENGERKY